MEILWVVFVAIWVCCFIGWLITMIVPTWREEMYYVWWCIALNIANLGVVISALFV